MTAPYGTRRVNITPMARDRLSASERAEVQNTCRDRGFRLNVMWSMQGRCYQATLIAGGSIYTGTDRLPFEAWRKALAQRDGVQIVSVLNG